MKNLCLSCTTVYEGEECPRTDRSLHHEDFVERVSIKLANEIEHKTAIRQAIQEWKEANR